MKRDGHIHSPFCPHGSTDELESYIEKAIISGFTDISFTEHAPLPASFIDPTPLKDSGMSPKALTNYLDAINQAKDAYKDQIRIRTGLEVDFISGFENETRNFLDHIGPYLDDSILSVHFLKTSNGYYCADYSKDVFMELAEVVGSVEEVYKLYYQTLADSIKADLGRFKPTRIGHPTLIHKFQKAHGDKVDDTDQIKEIFQLIAKAGYEIDANGAGYSKPYCLESYPPAPYLTTAESLGIPLVFGSDAHNVNGLHKHYEKFIIK